ncbi:hypothetical protein AB835_10195 [Candidatus Endobugula sertula]|uniref:Semialdehyde dehydrogenase NAD-binding domain-containing protein n=1 Tax=Candidatus Endobugula sertula TaxID=62101 RepID=A0A1D2QNQ4_9GAMM|nr:hypothetical protein AB835_10195 [Candidatus Endobugula sertula]
MDTVNLAIIGATGAVGEAIVELLDQSTFPVQELYLLASERTAGTSLMFRNKPVMVGILEDFDFSQVHLAIFVATDEVSSLYVPKAEVAGCLVIDNSQTFADSAPLVIPGVNNDQLTSGNRPSVVVNPDSSVIFLWTVLKPIYDQCGIYRVNVTVCDSVSHHGKKALHELAAQTASLLNGQGAAPKVYNQQIAFNVLSNVGGVDENGHSARELRIVKQSEKIIVDPQLQLNVTCIQVPVFYADSMVVTIETSDPIDANEVRKLLEKCNEIIVLDNQEKEGFATPVTAAAGKSEIFVSRIRNDMGHSRGINLWLVADNVRKGAARNTIMIAEELKKSFL